MPKKRGLPYIHLNLASDASSQAVKPHSSDSDASTLEISLNEPNAEANSSTSEDSLGVEVSEIVLPSESPEEKKSDEGPSAGETFLNNPYNERDISHEDEQSHKSVDVQDGMVFLDSPDESKNKHFGTYGDKTSEEASMFPASFWERFRNEEDDKRNDKPEVSAQSESEKKPAQIQSQIQKQQQAQRQFVQWPNQQVSRTAPPKSQQQSPGYTVKPPWQQASAQKMGFQQNAAQSSSQAAHTQHSFAQPQAKQHMPNNQQMLSGIQNVQPSIQNVHQTPAQSAWANNNTATPQASRMQQNASAYQAGQVPSAQSKRLAQEAALQHVVHMQQSNAAKTAQAAASAQAMQTARPVSFTQQMPARNATQNISAQGLPGGLRPNNQRSLSVSGGAQNAHVAMQRQNQQPLRSTTTSTGLGAPLIDEKAIEQSPMFSSPPVPLAEGMEKDTSKRKRNIILIVAIIVAVVAITVAITLVLTLGGGASNLSGGNDASQNTQTNEQNASSSGNASGNSSSANSSSSSNTSSNSRNSSSSSSSNSQGGATSGQSGTVTFQYVARTAAGKEYRVEEVVEFGDDGDCGYSTMDMTFEDDATAKAFTDSLARDYGSTFKLDLLEGPHAIATIDNSGLHLNREEYENALRYSVTDLMVYK